MPLINWQKTGDTVERAHKAITVVLSEQMRKLRTIHGVTPRVQSHIRLRLIARTNGVTMKLIARGQCARATFILQRNWQTCTWVGNGSIQPIMAVASIMLPSVARQHHYRHHPVADLAQRNKAVARIHNVSLMTRSIMTAAPMHFSSPLASVRESYHFYKCV